MTIEVIEAGPLTSVQDAFGRPGWRHLGVPVGGATDPWSARLANRLVGNPDNLALLEVTLGGAALRFDARAVVALTGGLAATVDGPPLPAHTARPISDGSVVRVTPGSGARGYLSVAGGVIVEPVLGSKATDLRTGFGGFEGRALRAGDRLAVGSATAPLLRWTGTPRSGPIRIVEGPGDPALDGFLDTEWTVTIEADRTGVRLDGGHMRARGRVDSMGLPPGAIQIPPDGRPIVMLADRPVTGGYPVVACVIRADIGRVAQLLPGDKVAFARVSARDARGAFREREDALTRFDVLFGRG